MLLREARQLLLTSVLHALCLNAATIPINVALPQQNEPTPSNTSSSTLYQPSGPNNPLIPHLPPSNLTTNDPTTWTTFIATGLRRAQTAFPNAYPVLITTSSCDNYNYPHWNYLDCYTISLSGPTATSAVSISGRWDQLNGHAPWWDRPVHLPGGRGDRPRVPWPPMVGLEAAEGLARGMGYVKGYRVVELEGVRGEGGASLVWRFWGEGGVWHVSFHDSVGGGLEVS